MTYCVGLKLKAGLVLLSDTRTNAGVDNIGRFKKMFVYEQCAKYGLPCPVTGHASGKVASEMAEAAGGGSGSSGIGSGDK